MGTPYFTGPFAPMLEKYVSQKRAAGLVYSTQAKRLRQFDNFCKGFEIHDFSISEDVAQAWYRPYPNEKDSSRRDRIQAVHGFAEFLCTQGFRSCLFPEIPRRGERYEPYIFSREQMEALFGYFDRMEPGNFSTGYFVYPVLFRVLYGCGTRISETLMLKKQDVGTKESTLHIRHGKNDNERILPVSGSLSQCLKRYMETAHADTPPEMPLFYTKAGTSYTRAAVNRVFRTALWDTGVVYRGKGYGPRLHDVRHTFACHNIQEWAESGIPIHSRLPVLSRYLGHRSVLATMWYLRLTADVYPHIREICQESSGRLYSGIPGLDREGAAHE